MKSHVQFLLISVSLGFLGCGARSSDSASSTQAIEDATSITQRGDGRFDVRCRDGRLEIATSDQIRDNSVCSPLPPTSSSPYSDSYCQGRDLSQSEAFSMIPLPNSTALDLGEIHIAKRARICFDSGSCGAWNEIPNNVEITNLDLLTTLWIRESGGAPYYWYPFFERSSGYRDEKQLSLQLENNSATLSLSLKRYFNGNLTSLQYNRTLSIPITGTLLSNIEMGFLVPGSTLSANPQQNPTRQPSAIVVAPLFNGKVTRDCFVLHAQNEFPTSLGNGNSGRVQQQFAFYSARSGQNNHKSWRCEGTCRQYSLSYSAGGNFYHYDKYTPVVGPEMNFRQDAEAAIQSMCPKLAEIGSETGAGIQFLACDENWRN